MEKARSLPADAVILDLEDAVAPDGKASARDAVMASVAAGGFGRREVVIRINGADTPWFAEDVAAAAKANPDAVLIPKISRPENITAVARELERLGADPALKLWAMMETPEAMLRAHEIAQSNAGLAAFVMGTNDLLKELGARAVPGRAPLMTGIGLSLLAARAAKIAILDGVYNDIKNLEGFEAECAQGRDLGFDGKTLIHPSQIEIANRIFAPSPEELAEARRIVAAFEAAAAEGKGVVQLDGKMIEALHVESARRAIGLSEAIGD